MSAVCPQGHMSQSEDYCDTCGAPIGAATPTAAPAAPPEPPDPPQPQECPHCGASNAPKALFCENCGYDFTTGTAPQPREADPLDLGAPGPTAAPAAAAPAAAPEPDRPEESAAAAPVPGSPAEAVETDPSEAGEEEADPGESHLPTPATPGPDAWVVEVWVDPDWYAAQKPEDPMPPPGSPRVVPLREASVLVGRPSASRNIRPQVDAGADTGVSRRHCQLSTDGQRWWVEDLGSANGTYVGATGAALPTEPLEVGVRHELADDERVFIGGWTRLVVRTALPGEV